MNTEPARVTAPQYLYQPDGSCNLQIELPENGEAIMARLLFPVIIGPPLRISSGVTEATGTNYYLCFVAAIIVDEPSKSTQLSVWVCLGFSSK